jgi:MATE family multidrug resistance protein
MADRRAEDEERRAGLLNGDAKKADWQVLSAAAAAAGEDDDESDNSKLGRRVWAESKKLWVIVAPAIFSRVVTFSMNVITQAFAGHIGDLELAAISIANTVVVGFNFGLMVRRPSPRFHPPT